MPKLLLLAALAAVISTAAAPPSRAAQPTAVRASVAQGPLRGTVDQGVAVFRGVPFAAPPVGRLRWAPPAAPLAWAGVRDAARFGASCPQTLASGGRDPWTTEYMAPAEPGVSEDCLFLNIWTPEAMTGARPRAGHPVLLFIHGGGYNEGAGSVAVYNGANLARKGVVVVNLNYRLRQLGFMAHPQLTAEQGGASGNYGIQDQIAALEWIRRNISAFGGDPAKVTIAGQSAGAGSVQSLLVSPRAKGLFRAAILQSAPAPGTNGNYPPLASAEQQGVAALAQMGAADIAAARALPLDRVMTVTGRAAPIADGKVVPPSPSPPMASNVPMMIGYTLNDLFGSRSGPVAAAAWKAEAAERYGERAAEFLRYYPGDTDPEATYSAHRESADRLYSTKIVEWMDRRGASAPVFAYLFSHVEPGPKSATYGAFHTSEVPYEFDSLALSPGRAFTEVDRALADQFSSYVANFVKTGDPNGASLPRWAPLAAGSKAIMELGDKAHLSRAVPAGSEAVLAAGKPPTSGRPAPAPPAAASALR